MIGKHFREQFFKYFSEYQVKKNGFRRKILLYF